MYFCQQNCNQWLVKLTGQLLDTAGTVNATIFPIKFLLTHDPVQYKSEIQLFNENLEFEFHRRQNWSLLVSFVKNLPEVTILIEGINQS